MRFNNVLFSRNLNQNILYIELFLEKNCKNLGALKVPPPQTLTLSLLLTRIVGGTKPSKCAILRLKYYNRVTIAKLMYWFCFFAQ